MNHLNWSRKRRDRVGPHVRGTYFCVSGCRPNPLILVKVGMCTWAPSRPLVQVWASLTMTFDLCLPDGSKQKKSHFVLATQPFECFTSLLHTTLESILT